jgi:hypothetical protein
MCTLYTLPEILVKIKTSHAVVCVFSVKKRKLASYVDSEGENASALFHCARLSRGSILLMNSRVCCLVSAVMLCLYKKVNRFLARILLFSGAVLPNHWGNRTLTLAITSASEPGPARLPRA